MGEKDDGGPAFPFAATDQSNVPLQTGGMSLRDYFATAALAHPYTHEAYEDRHQVATWAYQIADAMLAERRRRL